MLPGLTGHTYCRLDTRRCAPDVTCTCEEAQASRRNPKVPSKEKVELVGNIVMFSVCIIFVLLELYYFIVS